MNSLIYYCSFPNSHYLRGVTVLASSTYSCANLFLTLFSEECVCFIKNKYLNCHIISLAHIPFFYMFS